YRPQHSRAPRGPRTRGGPVRAVARIGADSPELRQLAVSERTRQLERRTGSLPNGPYLGRRRRKRRVSPGAGQTRLWTEPARRNLRDPFPQYEERPALEEVPARLRIPGWEL